MYNKLLKELEEYIFGKHSKSIEDFANNLDCIIKVKTIQAMDVSAELIANSRRVSRN